MQIAHESEDTVQAVTIRPQMGKETNKTKIPNEIANKQMRKVTLYMRNIHGHPLFWRTKHRSHKSTPFVSYRDCLRHKSPVQYLVAMEKGVEFGALNLDCLN